MVAAVLADGSSALPRPVGDGAPSSTSSAMSSCAGRVARREWRPLPGQPSRSLATALTESMRRALIRTPLSTRRARRPASHSAKGVDHGNSYRIADACALDVYSSGSAHQCSTPMRAATSAAWVSVRRSDWWRQPRTMAAFAGGSSAPTAVGRATHSTLLDRPGQRTCDAADVGGWSTDRSSRRRAKSPLRPQRFSIILY